MKAKPQSKRLSVQFLECIGLAFLYVVSAKLGQVFSIDPGNITPVWLPSGIIFAAMYLKGYYLWPGIFIGAFLGNVWAYADFTDIATTANTLVSGSMNGLGDSLCTLLGVSILKKKSPGILPHQSIDAARNFLVYSVAFGPFVSAAFGIAGLHLGGFIAAGSTLDSFMTWWTGDAVGVLVIGSTLLVLLAPPSACYSRKASLSEAAAFSVVLVGAAVSSQSYFTMTLGVPIPGLIILPVLIWGAFRMGSRETFLSLFIVSAISVIMTAYSQKGILSHTVNAVLVELQLFLAMIGITVLFVAVLIYQQKKVNEKLVNLKEKAESASRFKSQFLAAMSHDIRTPMNGMVGMTQILQGTDLDEKQKTCVANIEYCADNLVRITDDILDLARVESGKIELLSEPFSLQPLVYNISKMFEAEANAKGLTLSASVDEVCNKTFLGDKQRLSQVLTNLVSNAIKNTRQGSIDIKIHNVSGNLIRFSVIDTGAGISQEEQESIFDAFIQSRLHNVHGTGLGLYICKQLVEKMGSCINLVSTPGKGSHFYFDLDLPSCDETVDKPLVVKGPVDYTGLDYAVLIVEDNKVNQEVLAAFLDSFGCSYCIAENGEQALEEITSQAFDVVLMDCQLPVKNGYDTTRAIRKLDHNVANIPIIAITANAMKEDHDRCIASGMNYVLTKPVMRDSLYRMLMSL